MTPLRLRNPLSVIEVPNTSPQPKLYECTPTSLMRGPPFGACESLKLVYAFSDSSLVELSLMARVDQGFQIEENSWIGYRRNYFCVSAAFSFHDRSPDFIGKERFYVLDEDFRKVEVTSFFIQILALSFPDGDHSKLIQSDVKRLGLKAGPKPFRAVPGSLPMRALAGNLPATKKRPTLNKTFVRKVSSLKVGNQASILDSYPETYAFSLAFFDRLSFPSIVNWRKSSVGARCYQISVELHGTLDDESDPVTLSRVTTVPIQVRLRSPSAYNSPRAKLEREDSPPQCYSSPLKKKASKIRSPSTSITPIEKIIPEPNRKSNKKACVDQVCHNQSDEASRYFRTVPTTPWWMDYADYSAPDPLDDFGFGLHLIEADEAIPRNFQPSPQTQPGLDKLFWPSIFDPYHVDYCQDEGV